MRFFGETNINFIGKRNVAYIISAVIILAGLLSLVINKGPAYSVDFTGGISLELDITPLNGGEAVDIQEVRDVLAKAGIEGAEIQEIKGIEGKKLILVKAKSEEGMADKITNLIMKNFPKNVDPENFIRQRDEIGPKIGGELRLGAIKAIFIGLLLIIIYIWWRFEFSFGFAAVLALFHDVLITVGIFSITGKEISLPVVAALLTIVGYSLNDTIVVFDRIREDLKLFRKQPFGKVINRSINETLSRTIITSLTTFLVVLSLYLFGGTVIHDFAFALLIGVVVGTYSSIFIASPTLVTLFNNKEAKQAKLSGKK